MRNKREHTQHAVVLILAVAGLIICTAPFSASSGLASAQQAAPTWSHTGSLNTPRDGYTATLLPNGKVLVTGGRNADGILASAELYNPSTGTWGPTGNLNAARVYHSATLLQNGKVLVAGGWANTCCPWPPDNTAELYDPATGLWSLTGNLNAGRRGHTATLLSNGTVLFAGGDGLGGAFFTAELYNPGTGTWSFTGNLNGTRIFHAATLLQDGKVLVVGGCGEEDCFFELGSAELYDPNTGAWSPTGSLNTVRYIVGATVTLPNGNVLVAGGNSVLNSAELYSPATGRWSYTGSLLSSRAGATTLLPSGQVLIAGGCIFSVCLTAELYDPANGNWHETASLNTGRFGHTATLLLNGKVLVVGGYGPGSNNLLQSAELYDSGSSSTTNPIDDAQFFVRQQYLDFLGREPEPAGFAGWLNILNNCGITVPEPCDRIEVSSAFFRSPEFQGRGYFIYRFYPTVAKVPVFSEFTPDFAKVSGFLTDQQLEAARAAFVIEFMARADFQTRYASTFSNSTAYVDALLQTVGLPNHQSRQTWINALQGNNSAPTRAQVLRSLVESAEVYNKYYNEAFVLMQYFGYLRRTADAAYLQWIQTMNQNGGDYRIMINGFMNSLEYRQRFGS